MRLSASVAPGLNIPQLSSIPALWACLAPSAACPFPPAGADATITPGGAFDVPRRHVADVRLPRPGRDRLDHGGLRLHGSPAPGGGRVWYALDGLVHHPLPAHAPRAGRGPALKL